MKNTDRFSERVENYRLYRPHYPKEILSYLKKEIGLNKRWKVADIGSGTGLSSELFLENGNSVFAVEPNKEMRQAAEKIFSEVENFHSVIGTAESTHLENRGFDLIIAGQAFHWFEETAAKLEFQRIANDPAYLLLMWNERKAGSQFQKAYEQMLLDFAENGEQKHLKNINEPAIRQFFSPHECHTHTILNSQEFSYEGLAGRLLSSSYTPLGHQANYAPMMERLKELFAQYQQNQHVRFEYDCKLFYGRIK